MLPYINLPDPSPYIHIFGIIVAVAVLVGIWLARRRTAIMGVDGEKLESLINWMLLSGFVFCHILDEIFYHPDEILRRPWSLLFFWEGLSSLGGLIGAAIGLLLWKRYKTSYDRWRWNRRNKKKKEKFVPSFDSRQESLYAYADLILSVFPISWIIGRFGCATVHDHKGAATLTPNILTVAFPDGPHYDLGLLEMLYAIVISAVCISLWGKKRAPGLYIGITCVMYAPVRFALDFLRLDVGPTGDRRYLSLTFAQFACVAMLVYGIYMLVRARRLARSSAA